MAQSIGIIGATGKAGRDLYAEAARRGHRPTALIRSAQRGAEVLGEAARVVEVDAFALTADQLREFDVVVDAFGTAPVDAERQITLTEHLVGLARQLGDDAPRLIFILGAGSLLTGEDRHPFLEDMEQMEWAQPFIEVPRQQKKQLERLRGIDDVEWTGVSPSALFAPGPATAPVLGDDDLLIASDGQSHTTTGTMAVALLDEIETPAHPRARFTVGDA